MKTLLLCLLIGMGSLCQAQPQDIVKMLETARGFQRQADYDNAALVLNKALEISPTNMELRRELAFTLYLNGQNDRAAAEIKKIIDNEEAEEQVYQVAGMIYRSMQDFKEADRIYKKGIKKYPSSGPLYNAWGEILYQKEPSSAASIKAWEKGIELDPNFSGNYYNASRYYGTTGNNVWSLLYGELFVNLESYTTRTIEIKNILYDIYKQWFLSGNTTTSTAFEQQVAASLNKQSKESSYGLGPEVLTAIRTRFILDWYNGNASRPAFRLFDYQRQLLQEGLFDAYNQWLFGSVSSTAAYQNWVGTHSRESSDFITFQKGRIFKIPSGQYYGKP